MGGMKAARESLLVGFLPLKKVGSRILIAFYILKA